MTRCIRAAIIAGALLASSPYGAQAQSGAATADAVLHDLTGLDELWSLFEADHGTVRVVLLLSPT